MLLSSVLRSHLVLKIQNIKVELKLSLVFVLQQEILTVSQG